MLFNLPQVPSGFRDLPALLSYVARQRWKTYRIANYSPQLALITWGDSAGCGCTRQLFPVSPAR